MTSGGKNLILLGVGSVGIAIVTTVISLAIYHNSGDIYLDRSRPGYLPDEEEAEKNEVKKDDNEYKFSDSGEIDKKTIKQYREELEKVNTEIKKLNDPYTEEALSDDALGIK